MLCTPWKCPHPTLYPPHTFWLRVRSSGVWQRRGRGPVSSCSCSGSGWGLGAGGVAGDGSPSSMPTSCSSGSASVSLLASDEEGLMGSSFSFSTSAPVGEGWLSPPEQGRGCSHHPWAGGEGRHHTCFEEQLGERGGAQAGRQVQGGVPSEGPAVDVCSQLWRKARGREDGPPGPASPALQRGGGPLPSSPGVWPC